MRALLVEIMRDGTRVEDSLLVRVQSALELARDQLVRQASYGAPLRATEKQAAALRSGALNELVCRFTNGVNAQGWPEGLALVHSQRRQGRGRGIAIHRVRELCRRVADEASGEERVMDGAPHVRIAPRGGLELHSEAARAQARALSGLIEGLREPIRLRQLRSLETFLLCPIAGRALILVLEPEQYRHQRELEAAFQEGALLQGVALGAVVRAEPLINESVRRLIDQVGTRERRGPLAILVDLHRRQASHAVVHPGLGDPDVGGRADRVVAYLRSLLGDARAGAPPGTWCHRGGVGGEELVSGLDRLGLLGAAVGSSLRRARAQP